MADEQKDLDERDEEIAEAVEVDPAPEAEAPAPADETPAEEPTAEAEATEEEADEAPAEEPAEEPVAEAEEAAAEEPAKKPRRSRAKKTEEPAEAPAPKPAKPAANGQVRLVRAQAKYVRTSARKARLVCDHIRGKSVDDARAILAHTPRHVARDWSKLLESAVANAENNHELVGDDLKIVAVKADEGPTLKRFQPRAMGRATKIRKRTSHLTITLGPKE
jgi:ribosomal protein L22